MSRVKHVLNGDQYGGWYCYACRFWTLDVAEAVKHDGTYTDDTESHAGPVQASQDQDEHA